MIYVVIGTTFMTYLLNIYALKTLSPTVIGSFIYLQPIITIIFALLTDNDTLDSTKIIACALVFIGVYLVSIKNKNDWLSNQKYKLVSIMYFKFSMINLS